jgi:hypothetical protein
MSQALSCLAPWQQQADPGVYTPTINSIFSAKSGLLPHFPSQHGRPKFKAWFVKSDLGIGFLFRLAQETGVVLLPGNGFEVVDTSARVSLANLTDIEYAAIGKFTRQVLDEYYQDFLKIRGKK